MGAKEIKIQGIDASLISSRSEIESRIENILKINEPYNYQRYYDLIFNGPILFPNIVKKHKKCELTLIRARVIDESQEDISCIRTFSCPPANLCKMQRANIGGFPVLYCSESPFTAIKEAGANVGDNVFIAVYKNKQPFDFNAYMMLFYGVSSKNTWKIAADECRRIVSDRIKGATDAQRDALLYLYEVVSKLFLSQASRITATIAHSILYQNKADIPIHGIIYPSVVNEEFCNFALSLSCVQSFVPLSRVLKVKLTSERGDIRYLLAGDVDHNSNNIFWRGIEEKDKLDYEGNYVEKI